VETRLSVAVKPGSKAPGIVREGSVVTLRVRERAVEGAANEACIRALALALGIAPSRISLLRGARSRQKVFTIRDLDDATVEALISAAGGG
jgi:uncharacterized protein YggU (UPF0235/DUF167 family)